MRFLHTFIEFAKRAPRGHNADGRAMGLGLAVAMARANRQTTADVEQFLRHRTDIPQQRRAA